MENINQQSTPIQTPLQQPTNIQPVITSSNPPRKSKTLLLILIGAVIIFILIGVGAYLYLATTKNSSPISDSSGYYTKFNGPFGRFSFEYPAKWRVLSNSEAEKVYGKNKEYDEAIYVLDYPKDSVITIIAEGSYSITEGSIEKNFSEALEKQKTELSAKGRTNFSQSQFKIGDNYFFRLNFADPSYNLKGIFLYIVKTNTSYSVTLGSDESKYNQVLEDFEHLIQTFE